MPAFELMGTDGAMHRTQDWKGSRVLAVAFLCNHCTESQLYESRLDKLATDYASKGVIVVAIQSSNPKAFTDDDLAWSDAGESLDDMKERASLWGFHFPYLYDGDTGSVATALGATVAPSVFIFDQNRKLQYRGRIDGDPAAGPATVRNAAAAIDAILAGKRVVVPTTVARGCALRLGAGAAVTAPAETGKVSLSMATAEVLGQLRRNPTGELLMVNFYATWCGPC
ncbi:MAG: redoxin family protein, partial [Candidatus Solibacter sp.]|nr:redoxin family protein [Candidatus Solibacter sp.]